MKFNDEYFFNNGLNDDLEYYAYSNIQLCIYNKLNTYRDIKNHDENYDKYKDYCKTKTIAKTNNWYIEKGYYKPFIQISYSYNNDNLNIPFGGYARILIFYDGNYSDERYYRLRYYYKERELLQYLYNNKENREKYKDFIETFDL